MSEDGEDQSERPVLATYETGRGWTERQKVGAGLAVVTAAGVAALTPSVFNGAREVKGLMDGMEGNVNHMPSAESITNPIPQVQRDPSLPPEEGFDRFNPNKKDKPLER